MDKVKHKQVRRCRRKAGIRKRVLGTPQRPRLTVYRSLNHIYAQVIDDDRGHTLAAATSLEMKRKDTKTDVAKAVGEKIAQSALSAGVTKVVFDRGGYKYHGRVKALADAARSEGLSF